MDLNKEGSSGLELLNKILESMPNAGSDELIPILQKIQQAYGYLPVNVLMTMSSRTGIPASRIYGVATFYEQFHLEPHGRHKIRCCRGTACHVDTRHPARPNNQRYAFHIRNGRVSWNVFPCSNNDGQSRLLWPSITEQDQEHT
jgi:NADH:ubiquinone oxidoreductase subunit E